MADCAACGTRLDEGITKCPQCGANLTRPGAFLQTVGWVGLCVATVPLTVAAVVIQQRTPMSYVAAAFGAFNVVAAVAMIVIGKARSRSVPDPTRPSAPPATSGLAG